MSQYIQVLVDMLSNSLSPFDRDSLKGLDVQRQVPFTSLVLDERALHSMSGDNEAILLHEWPRRLYGPGHVLCDSSLCVFMHWSGELEP